MIDKKMIILGHKIIGNREKYILVLHELMGDHRNYDPILPYIDTSNFTYIFVDLRGYGMSKEIFGDYTCVEAANDVKNLISHLKLTSVNLLAHSMSTMIAQKIALIDERIKQLILITPISAEGIKMKQEAQNELILRMQQNKNKIEEIVESASKRYNKIWFNYRVKMAYEASIIEARVGYMKMYLTTNFIHEAKNIKVPIKIMTGKYDFPVFSKQNIEKLFEPYYNDFKIIECQEAGHYPMIECPVYFVSEIEKISI